MTETLTLQNSSRIYTSGEAAQICSLSLSTVKRWIRRGALSAYRTPGGDFRITAEHLRDFMREYDIPLSRLEREEPRVLTFVAKPVLRRQIIKSIYRAAPQARVELVENEFELGFVLSSFRPWAVVLQGLEEKTAAFMCKNIRSMMSPEPVRIGLVGPFKSQGNSGTVRPDVCSDEPDLDCDTFAESLMSI